MNHCPVYTAIGGHAYGWVYPGPIGAVLTPALIGVRKAGHLPNASTFCGRCEEVCPMKIPLPGLMRHWREAEFSAGDTPAHLQAGAQGLGGGGQAAAPLSRAGARSCMPVLGALGRRRGAFRRLPLAGGWTRHRDLAAPQGRTFQALWADTRPGCPDERRNGRPRGDHLQDPAGRSARTNSAARRVRRCRSASARAAAAARARARQAGRPSELRGAVPPLPRGPVGDRHRGGERRGGARGDRPLPALAPTCRCGCASARTPTCAALAWGSEPALERRKGPAAGDDEVGLSHATAAVAETGTLVLASGADNPVTLNFLPETHIVVVEDKDLVGGYEGAWDKLRARFGRRAMPRTVNLVSGPSRTADIGGQLVMGAHGPRRLCVILVRD